ncbi:hypothetical protein JB92DRAFT_3010284 [Gautieria morchelliformis]|nr:hypothetical protein JB92DRAFT_3010284 [Gautieria morchelliformis]
MVHRQGYAMRPEARYPSYSPESEARVAVKRERVFPAAQTRVHVSAHLATYPHPQQCGRWSTVPMF